MASELNIFWESDGKGTDTMHYVDLRSQSILVHEDDIIAEVTALCDYILEGDVTPKGPGSPGEYIVEFYDPIPRHPRFEFTVCALCDERRVEYGYDR